MGLFRLHTFIFTLLLVVAQASLSQTLTVGGYHYPPFMNSNRSDGLYLELTQAIEQHSSLSFDWGFYPYARVDHLFHLGDVHIEIGSSPLWNQHKDIPGKFSESFYELEDVAVFRKSEPQRARNDDDIRGQKIGIVRGYTFPQFANTFQKDIAMRIEGNDEQQLLHLLVNKRIDQAFMSKHVFLYLKAQYPEYQPLTFKDVVGRYQVAIRVHPQHQNIIPELNRSILQLKQKNLIKQIFEQAN